MPYLRAVVFILALAGTVLFAAPVQWLARQRGWRVQHSIQTKFCRAMCAIIGIRVQAHGRLPAAAPRLVVVNHVSWTDVIALASLHPFVFLAKSEVALWPVLGFLAKLQGTVFVERANRRAIPAVNAALARALDEGRDLVLFAEGTSSDGLAVLKFNPAHFAALDAANNAEKAILAPVALAYTRPEAANLAEAGRIDAGWYGDMTFVPHLWSLMKRGGARCHILFGDAIRNDGGGRKALAAATEAAVRQLLEAAAK